MGAGGRVEPGPGAFRGRPISIRFNGATVPCYEGETVGAALHAHGERALMRSIKYHRPRGLFCCTGKCASCLVRVDGTPNVRACTTPALDGMKVETQNAFPSARRDLFAVVDKVYRTNFDYHARFIRPKALTPIYHRVIRAMAGFGKVPDLKPLPPRRPAIRRAEVDVAVVGAGPAGLSAATAAAEAGARVLLVDEGERAGGSLLLEADAGAGRHGVAVADELLARIQRAGGEALAHSTAFGVYMTDGRGDAYAPPGLLAVLTPERIVEVRAKSLVVASGYHETPPLFPGNDLPGVMGARAALILLHRHGILPGRAVAVAADTPLARRAADDLRKAGADVVGIVGDGAWKRARIVEAHGGDRVEGIVLDREGETLRARVDCVLSAGDETPRVELLQQVGARLEPRGWSLAPRLEGAATTLPGVFAAGTVAGMAPLGTRLADGARAGEAAARHAKGDGP